MSTPKHVLTPGFLYFSFSFSRATTLAHLIVILISLFLTLHSATAESGSTVVGRKVVPPTGVGLSTYKDGLTKTLII